MHYWKCPKCLGAGKTIQDYGGPPSVRKCYGCDGTGNALIDGAARAHQRRIDEIEKSQRASGSKERPR